jgi:hypothetical protein
MRPDMSKVLVERPRLPSRVPYGRDGRKFRDTSDAAFLPMKAGYRELKSLNENLRPLARFLASQIGRPWNKVHSELCAVIDGRNAVQRHILEHLSDYVAVHTRVVNNVLVDLGARWYGLGRVAQPLYVDPRTGLLRRNPDDVSWRKGYRARKQAGERERSRVWRELSPTSQLHQLDGHWFEVEIAPLPPAPAIVWDAVRRISVVQRTTEPHRRSDDQATAQYFGRTDVYAASKRQLNAREIRAHGLAG